MQLNRLRDIPALQVELLSKQLSKFTRRSQFYNNLDKPLYLKNTVLASAATFSIGLITVPVLHKLTGANIEREHFISGSLLTFVGLVALQKPFKSSKLRGLDTRKNRFWDVTSLARPIKNFTWREFCPHFYGQITSHIIQYPKWWKILPATLCMVLCYTVQPSGVAESLAVYFREI